MSGPIPIANVYYLLCYAWNDPIVRDVEKLGLVDGPRAVQELLAKLLAQRVRRLIRRGITRGYRDRREDLAGARGKIIMGETAKRALRARGRVACEFEELSVDIPANQILRSTLGALLRLDSGKGLDRKIRDEVAAARRRLTEVSDVALSRQVFGQVPVAHDRRSYGFLLSLCRLVYECWFVDDRTGKARFRDFRPAKEWMSRLFEQFVRGFYRRESAFRVKPGGCRIWWAGCEARTEADRGMIPWMEADVVLESPTRRLILDAKYYENALGGKVGGKLHSEHLYQLLAYLRNREGTNPEGPQHEGILLYPRVDIDLAVDVRLEGFRVQARTIDLNQPWRGIHDGLLEIIGKEAVPKVA